MIHVTNIQIMGCRVLLHPEDAKVEQSERYQAETEAYQVKQAKAAIESAFSQRYMVGINGTITPLPEPPKPRPFIYSINALVDGGMVIIQADSDKARDSAKEIVNGHKANLDRIAELEEQLAQSKRLHNQDIARLVQERDEARQMHKERTFYEKAQLTQQIDERHARFMKLREAAKLVVDSQPGTYIGAAIEGLRKAMA